MMNGLQTSEVIDTNDGGFKIGAFDSVNDFRNQLGPAFADGLSDNDLMKIMTDDANAQIALAEKQKRQNADEKRRLDEEKRSLQTSALHSHLTLPRNGFTTTPINVFRTNTFDPFGTEAADYLRERRLRREITEDLENKFKSKRPRRVTVIKKVIKRVVSKSRPRAASKKRSKSKKTKRK